MMNLSKRLQTIATYIKRGSYFADIGSDHAYLPAYICLKDPKAKAIAGEVTKGPFERAKETVKTYHLGDQIDVRLGDGLSILHSSEVDTIIIAGMGGSLIVNILEKGKDNLKNIERLILQPNIGEHLVRKWLFENYYNLEAEEILKEKEKIYEIIVAKPSKDMQKDPLYNSNHLKRQLFFGPQLEKERSEIFLEKWKKQKQQIQSILEQFTEAESKDLERVKNFKEQLKWIQEVVQNEQSC